MRDKNITKEELAKAAKVNLKLLGQVLAGERLPDANEKRNIMAVLEIV
jgi:transcriptional regulator with XRE-family HTH domain